MFVVAGIMHFIIPKQYERIMPEYIPNHRAMVLWSGVFEILGGIGIMIPATETFSGYGLILLLIAVMPVHIDMFRKAIAKKPVSLFSLLTLIRIPIQFWIMYWVYASITL